ncbi:putative photosynthetic complex assembly protein PuhE [uncultured Aquincola sp.]|uniref:putative photosynthetic complex assembly protein PuhE n=1 Tax=uncultured Aquincola sp. TaxID=886556 RepID=UPI0032B22AB2
MQQAGPLLYVLLAWWFSTGAILWLVGLPRSTHPFTMGGATVLLAVALCGVAATADDTRVTGAYLAFTAALMVWAWQEVAFLLGYVTGPRRTPCPSDARRWQRAARAFEVVLFHELALLVLFAAVLALTWRQPNQVAAWTFGALWCMRQSSKLNVFLGVRNLNESFLPPHIAYLHSYFRQRPSNRLFPVSILLGTAATAAVWQAALQTGIGRFDETARLLTAALLTLGVLEHWLLVLPLPSEWLWKWGLRAREAQAGTAPAVAQGDSLRQDGTVLVPAAELSHAHLSDAEEHSRRGARAPEGSGRVAPPQLEQRSHRLPGSSAAA